MHHRTGKRGTKNPMAPPNLTDRGPTAVRACRMSVRRMQVDPNDTHTHTTHGPVDGF